ncbi:putative NDUFAF3/Mth938 domain-containing protein [Medicago truncatula]|uniref:NADH dehydrogenase [ubiquinone] 1 alpha subcomplex assembly factor 3 n=1 Tax=Medicago truncatula TaxID=3880 RepID=B7FHB1_MEDTR|nr:NADH dehydrogenase [ubiquinone] 1 alpha subcomplex assembly factor 3 [Medicago truncatula]ACJ84140.1 unknown [Medicago truncatula]AFK41483.1 unknown [Medicago truncatula]KEH17991.1 nuclear protein E3-3, putative [Medicago truncatula]RHN38814.1 putative NDUFAF3/Mth938 domain-containing protein [Medicago truncatula]
MAVRQRAVTALPNLIRSLRNEHPLKLKPSPHNNPNSLPSLRRAFSLYDQINLIDNVPEDQLRFQGFKDTGFTVNGVEYEGSLLCVGNLIMSWKPTKFSEITAESLSFFQIVRPIPEILIVGCGRNIQHVDPELRQFIRSTGMKLEAVDSRNAASTYNILNEEGRIVAAALLPYGVTS